jgi:hypothetical protein
VKTFRNILEAISEPVTEDDLKPGFQFFAVSANGRSLSRYKIMSDEIEQSVGVVFKVRHVVIGGDKFKQNFIAKDFVSGAKGKLKVFRNRKQATLAFKRAGFANADI